MVVLHAGARLLLGLLPVLVFLVALVLLDSYKLVCARRRVGFLVDAAIAGFAVGAGFAAAENLQYFVTLGPSSLLLWVVRGFGTALMHGSAPAVLAILAKLLGARHGGSRGGSPLSRPLAAPP